MRSAHVLNLPRLILTFPLLEIKKGTEFHLQQQPISVARDYECSDNAAVLAPESVWRISRQKQPILRMSKVAEQAESSHRGWKEFCIKGSICQDKAVAEGPRPSNKWMSP